MEEGGRSSSASPWSVQTGRYGVYRYKQIIGDHLRSRTPDRQRTEAMIGVAIVNRMTALGMPESQAIRI